MRRVALVSMPWHPLEIPALGLSILQRSLEASTQFSVDVIYENIGWANFLCNSLSPDRALEAYAHVATEGYSVLLGDWIFSPALHGRRLKSTHIDSFVTSGRFGKEVALFRKLADEYCRQTAKALLAGGYDIYGFTSTFSQSTASLAVAKIIKAEAGAESLILFGGPNCEGEQGIALARNYPFVDIVTQGEAETFLTELLLERRGSASTAPRAYRTTWRRDHRSVATAVPHGKREFGAHPPDFSDFRAALDTSKLRGKVARWGLVETSRGCWWGEKHHCTFCGLNGNEMNYRKKPFHVVVDDIKRAAATVDTSSIMFVDNILDDETVDGVCATFPAGMEFFAEVKSNIRTDRVRRMRDSGFRNIQPGIESLLTKVLQEMKKGVSGAQNVRLLKDARTYGVNVIWNWLYGFPGELEDDYARMIGRLKSLWHLPPPQVLTRINVQRFSPYFEQREPGFRRLAPAPFYAEIYPFEARELYDLAYTFSSEKRGIRGRIVQKLRAAVEDWQANAPRSRLTWRMAAQHMVIEDGRGRPTRETVLREPDVTAFARACFMPIPAEHHEQQLRLSIGLGANRYREIWNTFEEQGLIFVDDVRNLIFLPCPA